MQRGTLPLVLTVLLVLAGASPAAAVDNPDYRTLINDINQIAVDNPDYNPQPLLATAMASQRAFLRGATCAALGALGALENQLLARFVDNPDFVDDPTIRSVMGDIAGIRAVLQEPDVGDIPVCVAPDSPD